MSPFIISGGDFFRTEGCLTLVDLDENTGELSLLEETWVAHPLPHMAIVGKGITGLCMDGDAAWVCFSNVIARVTVPGGEVVDLIEDEAFNDLHQLTRTTDGLVVANTGNESVDFIYLPSYGIDRVDLLGGSLRALRPQKAQNEDTKPHLHHLASACRNAAGDLIVGLGRQARILNLTRWSWIGPRLSAGIHDVHCGEDGSVWCTTINGNVHKISPDGVVQSWSLKDYQKIVGWTRGLAVTTKGMLIGTTAIRESNRDYYQSLVRAKVGEVDACMTWLPSERSEASILYPSDAGTRKFFSIQSL